VQSQLGAVERRRELRGTPESEPTRLQLVSMIVGMYREMPGLSLNLQQASRLFGVRLSTCEVVLEDLVIRGELNKTNDGQYVVR
jgi:hypothetical protein